MPNLIADFEQTEAWAKETRLAFSEHEMIELDYEDLASRTDEVFGQVTSWLGATSGVPTTDMERQNPEPLHALLTNYEEVAAVLRGTRWEGLLER